MAVIRPSRRFVAVAAAVAAIAGSSAAATAAPAHHRARTPVGLPTVSSGHRPGPDILYKKPPRAPQLENTGGWHAKPILISGADAYRNGEWLYQDYLFDDHGATGVKDTNDDYGPSRHLFSPAAGTFTYPTGKGYAGNAADLVEFRVKPLAKATAFRVTLDTLIDPAKVAFTVALGSSSSNVSWPFGAGVQSPAAFFLTWHGKTAVLQNAATGTTLKPAPSVHVDMVRRQITLQVPHAAWNPKRSSVRMTVGAGLWDTAAGTYLKPAPGGATATTPGGGTPQGVAIVNVGPRLAEPKPLIAGATIADTGAAGQVLAYFWRERQQSEQLTLGDVSPFFADVSFAKLLAEKTDNSGVPTSGPMDRIFASHFSFGQGLDATKICDTLAPAFSAGSKCIGENVGQLQPYAIYVPKKKAPAKGYGLTLLLHSLSANYNQYLGSHNQSELGDRGPGSIVVTPEGRGPDGFDDGVAEADTFEVWADAARHYRINPNWVDVTGYSMGGFSTYRELARWPDLFAKGWSVVGEPGSVDDQLASMRNTPLLLWNSDADELVNIDASESALKDDEAAGLRVTEDLFLTADHLTLAANDQFAPGVAWLGTTPVNRNPAHVTYVLDSTEDNAAYGVVADHAYWVSGLVPRGKGDATVDVLSKAFGVGDPPVLPVATSGGAVTGGEIPAMAYLQRSQQWGPTPKAAHSNTLVLTATNLKSVTIDVKRAHVTCGVHLKVKTDGPLFVTLAGCDLERYFA
jgi:hypothetical protein